MFYAGIGSRKTSQPFLALMERIGFHLAKRGWTLRSGGAEGADTAFERGAVDAGGATEVFLPRRGFFGRNDGVNADQLPEHAAALVIAREHHRSWDALSPTVRQLMSRNVHQILGADLRTPSRFVVCWAPGPILDVHGRVADARGGTGQALRVAYAYRIPVFHLGLPDHRARLEVMLAKEA